MSKNAISIVCITKSGAHMQGKHRRWNEAKMFLRERLTYKLADPFVQFVVIITRADAWSTTTIHQFNTSTALRFLAAKEAEKDRYRYRAIGAVHDKA